MRDTNITDCRYYSSNANLCQEWIAWRQVILGTSFFPAFVTASGELKALGATCTHLDCTVQRRADLGIIWCSCHNGRYDDDGKNISGPPPKPLPKYIVKEDKEVIFVSREDS